MKLSYFLGKQYLGSSEITAPGEVHSIAFFCRTCGEIWARVCADPPGAWDVQQSPCVWHNPLGVADCGLRPGSLLAGGRLDRYILPLSLWGQAVEVLPEVVLKREAELALKQLEDV